MKINSTTAARVFLILPALSLAGCFMLERRGGRVFIADVR
jgi:hypothetical protein